MPSWLWRRLREERGSSLVEGLLALGLVVLVVVIGVEGFAYMQARSVATAAAQDGAEAAATGGPAAGLARATQVLAAGGGASSQLSPSIAEGSTTVTVTISGKAPSIFSLGLLLPAVHASATLPLEQYAADEQAVTP